jgi:hypothetical protein
MSESTWTFDTRFWSLVSPQVATELRVFPIAVEGSTLVLLTDEWSVDPEKRIEFAEVVQNNVGRPVQLEYWHEYEKTKMHHEGAFDELLDEFYKCDDLPQSLSAPVSRNMATVVLIDPNGDHAKVLKSDFKENGFRVRCASTLNRALRILKSHNGMIRTVFIASDVEGGYDHAVQKITSLYRTTECLSLGEETTICSAPVVDETAWIGMRAIG